MFVFARVLKEWISQDYFLCRLLPGYSYLAQFFAVGVRLVYEGLTNLLIKNHQLPQAPEDNGLWPLLPDLSIVGFEKNQPKYQRWVVAVCATHCEVDLG